MKSRIKTFKAWETYISDQNEFQKELEEKIIAPLTEKIASLESKIKKLLKDNEKIQTFEDDLHNIYSFIFANKGIID